MFDLRNSLPFVLQRTASRMAETFAARELQRSGISLPMFNVLATLLRNDDQRLGDLAALADMEISTLSRLIGAMQTKRLVSRRRSGKDARAVRIRVTDQGRSLAQKLIAAASSHEAAAIRGLVPRQIQELKRALAQIDETLAASAEDQDADRPRAQRRSSAA